MMRVLAINPTKTTLACLKELGVSYEIVESADKLPAEMSAKFAGHDGFFDGVIAPNNPPPGTMRTISDCWYVRARGLPVFVFGSTRRVKERVVGAARAQVTLVYRTSLKDGMRDWLHNL